MINIFCSLEVMMESHVNYMEDLQQLTGNLHISYHLTPPNVEKWSRVPWEDVIQTKYSHGDGQNGSRSTLQGIYSTLLTCCS